MKNWKKFIELSDKSGGYDNNIKTHNLKEEYGVYGDSINITKECSCFMALDGDAKILVVTAGTEFENFEGEETTIAGKKVKVCVLSNYNSGIIRKIFKFTNPVPAEDKGVSLGLGDRLGLASAGHIRLLKGKNIFPILAQQSIRELNLTGRTYGDVLASAVWAVMQEGYKNGYGADGDHLKTGDEVVMALDSGFTMITLDCSEHINNGITELPDDVLSDYYLRLGSDEINYWENKYLNKKYNLGIGKSISISKNELMKTVLTYLKAISFAEGIYNDILRNYTRKINFEISIDETLSVTSPGAHFIIASEFMDRGVAIQNLAPRFCGEFQKGIDYKGDIEQFRHEFEFHCSIAKYFGYKISVHSGSDKFSIFPIVGEKTKQNFHLKTAGTNWLEAIRVIAFKNPALFRRIYQYAVKKLPDAKKYYHIFTEAEMVPDITGYADEELPKLMGIEEARQALHVTYGYLLCEKNTHNSYIFRDEFFQTMHLHEEVYYELLEKHIGRHLEYLGI